MDLAITFDVSDALRRLGGLAAERFDAALVAGATGAGEHLASSMVQAIQKRGDLVRTGHLWQSVGQWTGEHTPDAVTVYVGVPADADSARYAYLLTRESREIKPLGHRYLAIPIGANLTPAGVARIASPRTLERDTGLKVAWRGMTVGVMSGEDYEPYFALAESVYVVGRGVLEEQTETQAGALQAIVAEELAKI